MRSTMRILIFGLFLNLFSINGYSTAIVAGKIHSNNDELTNLLLTVLQYDPFIEDFDKKQGIPNEDGIFRIEVQISDKKMIYLDMAGHGWVYLMMRSNDSVYVDADMSGSLVSTKITGDNSVESQLLSGINSSLSEFYFSNRISKKDLKLGLIEFQDFLKNRTASKDSIINRYLTDATSQSIRDLVRLNYSYFEADDYMDYGRENSKVLALKEYWEFAERWPIQDISLNSCAAKSYYRYLYAFNINLMKKDKSTFDEIKKADNKKEYAKALSIYTKFVLSNFKGKSKDLLLAQAYLELVLKDVRAVETSLDSVKNRFTETSILNEITLRIDKYKSQPDIAAINIEGGSFKEFIKNEGKGKVIYLDFWATWCAPCIEEFKYSTKLEEHFKGKEVLFLYVASKSDYTKWQNLVQSHKPNGNHLFILNNEFNKIAKDFDILGYPTYAIVDKKGNIYTKKAPRPSSDETYSLLEKLVDE